MSAHTPGPWKISNHIDEDDFADIEAENDLLYIRATWGGVVRHADRPRLNRIIEANARLIAAAPDLLAAAQAFISYDHDGIHEDDHLALMLAYAEVLKLCREAIAKATGSAE